MGTNEIIKLFTNGHIVFEDIISKRLECNYGIQLVQKGRSSLIKFLYTNYLYNQ